MKLGALASNSADNDAALSYFAQAERIYLNRLGEKNSKLGELYQHKGDLYGQHGEYRKAVEFYTKSLEAISSASGNGIPDLTTLDNKPLGLAALQKMAQADVMLHQQTKSNDLLVVSLRLYDEAIKLIDEILAGYHLDLSIAQLQQDSRKVYEQALQVALMLYRATGEEDYLHKAFQVSEKSKSHQLLAKLTDPKAMRYAGVQDSLVDRERDLKIELSYYKKLLREAKATNDQEELSRHQKNVFAAQNDYEQLKLYLAEKYPGYYDFKFHQDVSTVPEITNSLAPNAAIIEYFDADTVIYSFVISRDTFEVRTHPLSNDFPKVVEGYQKSLTDHTFILNDPKKADSLYVVTASYLYRVLLGESLDQLGPAIDKLVIIPENRLSQINFSTFLRQPHRVSGAIQYQALSYLLKDYDIGYAYSATLKQQTFSKAKSTSFGGFAPSYKPQTYDAVDSATHPMTFVLVRDGKLPLPGAISEVSAISELMDGQPWLGQHASESNFKNHAGTYNIIHLAMHSLLNTEEPEYSELLFNNEQDTLNDGYLNIDEIYTLQLSANLVVLSACSSGSGKLQIGEGPISFSRAFSYAGCPSVVMSMWKIPDEPTQHIMVAFYKNLKSGLGKDEALRKAQLRYLNSIEDPLYRHPFFWGSFVATGDLKPVDTDASNWRLIVYITTALVLMLILVILYKRMRMA
jgi:CHAT domain-containing protein